MTDDLYGKRRVPRMMQRVRRLRSLIQSEGTPEIQTAWDDVEQFLDYFYGEIGQQDNERAETVPAD